METETITRILEKVVSLPGNTLYQDETLSCHRDRLISTCSEQLRLIRHRAAHLGKFDGNESRAALVLQHVMETMTPIEPRSSRGRTQSTLSNRNNEDELRSSSINSRPLFHRKCVPTIKDLASCIHVKPKALETLKKSLQFYFNDDSQQLKLSSSTAKGHATAPKDTHVQFLQQLSIRLVSMVDLEFNAQQVVASATKLYKDIIHFKLYGSSESQHFRSAAEYDIVRFQKYYCASCFLISLLGSCQQQVRNAVNARNKAANKTKENEKDIFKKFQQCILNNESLSSDTFEGILKYVQSIILDIQKQEVAKKPAEKKKGGNEVDLQDSASNMIRSASPQEGNTHTIIQNLTDDQPAEKKSQGNGDSTISDTNETSELDLRWGRTKSAEVIALCGSENFQRWKETTIKNHSSDLTQGGGSNGAAACTSISKIAITVTPADELKLQRQRKELVADAILREYNFN